MRPNWMQERHYSIHWSCDNNHNNSICYILFRGKYVQRYSDIVNKIQPDTCRMLFRSHGGPTDNINIAFINYAISQARKLTRGCQMCHVDASRAVKMYGRTPERKISATNFSLPSRRKNVRFNDDVMTRKWWLFDRKTHRHRLIALANVQP